MDRSSDLSKQLLQRLYMSPISKLDNLNRSKRGGLVLAPAQSSETEHNDQAISAAVKAASLPKRPSLSNLRRASVRQSSQSMESLHGQVGSTRSISQAKASRIISEKTHNLEHLIQKFIKDPGQTGFAYLQSRTTPDQVDFDPYDLVVVEYKAIRDDNYYTISANGVTHYFKGCTEFSSIQAWLQDRDNYHRMTKIPFFAKYFMWKAFRIWRKDISKTKFKTASRYLTSRMFLLDPVLRDALLGVQLNCINISLETITSFSKGQPFELDKYRKTQIAWIDEHLNSQLFTFQEKSFGYVNNACQATLEACEQAVRKNVGQQTNSGTTTRLTYTEQAARRNASRRLRRFVQLADYMIIGAVYLMGVSSAKTLLAHVMVDCKFEDLLLPEDETVTINPDMLITSNIKKPAENAPPLFIVRTLLEEDRLVLAPRTEDFIECIDMVFEAFLKRVDSILLPSETISCLDESVQRENGTESLSGSSIAKILEQDYQFDLCIMYTKGYLVGMMKASEQYNKTMTLFARMVEDNNRLDLGWLSPLEPENTDRAVKYFEESLSLYSKQQKQIIEIEDEHRIKNFMINLRDLKATLAPSPDACLSRLISLLPPVARALDESLLDKVNQSANILRSDPSNIEDLVIYLDHLDAVQEECANYEHKAEQIHTAYSLIEKFSITIEPTDFAFYQTLDPTMKRLKELLNSAIETRSDKVQSLTAELDKTFQEVTNKAASLRNRLQDPVIVDPTNMPNDALRLLNELGIDIDKLEASMKQVIDCQQHFGLPITRNVDIEAARDEFDTKKKFWVERNEQLIAQSVYNQSTSAN